MRRGEVAWKTETSSAARELLVRDQVLPPTDSSELAASIAAAVGLRSPSRDRSASQRYLVDGPRRRKCWRVDGVPLERHRSTQRKPFPFASLSGTRNSSALLPRSRGGGGWVWLAERRTPAKSMRLRVRSDTGCCCGGTPSSSATARYDPTAHDPYPSPPMYCSDSSAGFRAS